MRISPASGHRVQHYDRRRDSCSASLPMPNASARQCSGRYSECTKKQTTALPTWNTSSNMSLISYILEYTGRYISAIFCIVPCFRYTTRIGSNKGKTPEHNQAKHTKHPHSLEWHNSTITIVFPSTLRNTLVLMTKANATNPNQSTTQKLLRNT